MKVLMLNVNGLSGSTGKIVTDIKNVLESQGHECLICYGANDKEHNNQYVRIISELERKINAVISRVTGIRHGMFTPFSLIRFKRIVKEWKPDIVHIHCPNGYIIDIFGLLEYLGKNKIKTVLTNHAEYFYTGGCGHAYDCKKWQRGCSNCSRLKSKIGIDVSKIEWNRFKAAFDKFDSKNLIITSVSPWVMNRAKNSVFFHRFTQKTILNGINTDIFKLRPISNDVLKRLPKGKPIILHVTASFTANKEDIKGGWHVIELAKRIPHYNFVVACSYNDKIEHLPSNIFIWGKTNTQIELAELYNVADITVLTSRKETFSMVVAESLCCGTPVVGYKAGGPESIGIPKYSEFVDQGEIKLLQNLIIENINMKTAEKTREISSKSISKFMKEEMGNQYLKIYESLWNYKDS